MNNNIKKIRNFSIIAHVNHGKSTLAKLIIKKTNSEEKKEKIDDSEALCRFQLEKERGITFKLHAVQRIYWSFQKKDFFVFNLIDTPGHIDFRNEVLLSLSVCEGVILLIDATKGVQSQTLFYCNIAKELGLSIIPVINKIDIKNIDLEKVKKQIVSILNCNREKILLISAKNEFQIEELLEKVVDEIPSPIQYF